jgi:hypothetical protein
METTKMSLAEQLKMEIMERYGLREDQVRLELTVYTTDLEVGRTVLTDFNTKYPNKNDDLLPEDKACDSVYSQEVDYVCVHRKDGFYGEYIAGDDIE